MKWNKRMVGLSVMAASLSACGYLGSGDGGSGGGSPETSENTPAPEQSSAPNSNSNSNSQSQKTDVPLAVMSIDELMKSIGASDFVSVAASETELYTRLKEVEDLTGYDTTPSFIARIGVSKGSDGMPMSCTTTHMDSFRFMGRSLGGMDAMAMDFYEGFKERSDTSSSQTTTYTKLTQMPAFSTFAYAYLSDKKDDREHAVQTGKTYIGVTDDQLIQATILTKHINDRPDSLVNCARIYTRSTRTVKTSCSVAMRSLGYAMQVNDVSDETFQENHYAFKDTHALLMLAHPDDRMTKVTTFSQQGADTVAYDILDQEPKKPDTHVAGTIKLDSGETCSIASAQIL